MLNVFHIIEEFSLTFVVWEAYMKVLHIFFDICFSFKAVDLMRQGMSPSKACQEALSPVKKYYPDFSGAVVCVNNKGEHGEFNPSHA